ncbi:GILT-like protein 1 isoform X2 [Agrilus planipennis]|nr:GILT-like protein 1 isoform X2 [Agrilus planipennis]
MVYVDVYYESLCPDSIKFFTKQLYPSLQTNLSHFVNLTLLPYGKSDYTTVQNQLEFTCHHGPFECEGNKIQACALALIEKGQPSEGLGYNRITVGFINCLMDKVDRQTSNTTFPLKECAEINQVTNYVDIDNCAHHVDGSKHLSTLGELTKNLKPPLTSVPTIVFNKQYRKEDSDLAQENFVRALCQYIHHDKPAECSGSSGLKTSFTILVLLVSLAFAKLF